MTTVCGRHIFKKLLYKHYQTVVYTVYSKTLVKAKVKFLSHFILFEHS